MTVLISDEQVRKYFSMEKCVDAVEEAFAKSGDGAFDVSERKVVGVESQARLMSLTAASEGFGALVANIYSGAPAGVDKRTTTVNRRQKLYVLFDSATGACEAIVSGGHLAWLKTGAMGAVAIKHLAPESARRMAIIGSGRQARAALAGAMTVREFESVRVWSPTPGNAEKMTHEFAGIPDIAAVGSPEEAIRGSEVIVTATTSRDPVLEASWLTEGCHINAIGAHYPDQRELDAETVGRSTVFVDTLVAARAEKGELMLAEQEGEFSFDRVVAELGQVVNGTSGWERSPGETTLFASSGSAIESLGAPLGVLRAIPPNDREVFRF